MTHQDTLGLIRSATTSFLVVGIATVTMATKEVIFATNLSSGGVTLLDRAPMDTLLLPAPHAAAPLMTTAPTNAEGMLLVGMLLIVTGFLLHSWYIVRRDRGTRVAGKMTWNKKHVRYDFEEE